MLGAAAVGTLLTEDTVPRLHTGCGTKPAGYIPVRPHPLNRPSQHLRKRQRLEVVASASAALGERVRIVTKDTARAKRILAEVQVQATVDQIWSVLTNYNQLASFVPNLDHCERLPGATGGKQRILQRACSQSLFCRLQAEAVLDVEERFLSLGRRELHFTMVSGSFKEFSGRWILEPDPSVQDGKSLATILRYECTIVPEWSLPSTVVAAIIRCGLPANVQVIAKRAEQMAEKRRAAPKFAKAAFQENEVRLPNPIAKAASLLEEVLPAKGPPRATADWLAQSLPKANAVKARVLQAEKALGYLGMTSVPIPKMGWREEITHGSWQKVQLAPATDQSAASPLAPQQSNWRKVDEMRWKDTESAVLEIHLRRLDDALSIKRRAVASVQINAGKEDVWKTLTDYERLPEFIPGLAGCERLKEVEGAPRRLIRLRQVGFKRMMYMHLHAEATLAVVESPCSEIQFKQISGDFQMLQGKFMLGSRTSSLTGAGETTELRYAVEVELPRSTRMVGLLEPLLEQVVYEDIPTNLRAIKLRVEQAKAQEKSKVSHKANQLGRPTSKEMCQDFALLEEELLRLSDGNPRPPTRQAIRAMKRYDVETAIAHHGGMRSVAERMGGLAESPEPAHSAASTGLDLVKEQLEDFALEAGLPEFVLPSEKMLSQSKRVNLLRSARSWGGIEELAQLLGYKVADEAMEEQHSSWFHQDAVAEEGLSGNGSRRPARRKLLASFDVLAEELRHTFGQEGPLPSSTELRGMKRRDLAVAVAHHGGATAVTERMGWQKGFRGPNHWSDINACREAIDEFCHSQGLPHGVLPSVYSMQQAGRHDLPRAVRHWGGAPKLAQALGYEYRGSYSKGRNPADQKDGSRPSKAASGPSKMRDEIDSW